MKLELVLLRGSYVATTQLAANISRKAYKEMNCCIVIVGLYISCSSFFGNKRFSMRKSSKMHCDLIYLITSLG